MAQPKKITTAPLIDREIFLEILRLQEHSYHRTANTSVLLNLIMVYEISG